MDIKGMKRARWWGGRAVIAFAAMLLGVLLVAQQVVSLPGDTRLSRALLNALHTPWFFVLTLLAWWVLQRGLGFPFRRSLLLCAGGGVLLAFGTEAIQFFTSRDASLEDAGRNLLGMAAALSLTAAVRSASTGRAAALVAACGVFLLAGLLDLFATVWYYQQRALTAPVLLDARVPPPVLDSARGDWRLVPGLEDWPAYAGQGVLEVCLGEGQAYPGLRIREPFPDWSPWHQLVIEAFLVDSMPLPITVRVETLRDRGMETAANVVLVPGPNKVELPLEELIGSSVDGLPPVRNLLIFSPEGHGGRNYYLGSVRLE